ncbi:DsbA family protein [Yoonia sp. BS5-3]|uniref:DsbA family protein n=1 Tax=Yoonia phaeophyticola TaxID=3137369 RepID=A0ABZ2VB50_9RHOB
MPTLAALASDLGHNGDALIALAQCADVLARYAENASEALRANVFGSPSYVLAGEMFYGQDRLEMLDRALHAPFQPTRWRNPPVHDQK